MLIRRPDAIPAREITDPAWVLRRRDFLPGAAPLGAGAALPGLVFPHPAGAARRLPGVKPGPFGTDEERTPIEDATRYNTRFPGDLSQREVLGPRSPA